MSQRDRERTAHISGARRSDRLRRRPMEACGLAGGKGQSCRGVQPPHALVIRGTRGSCRVVQSPVHLPGQAALKPEADDRLGDAHQSIQVSCLRRPVHGDTQVIQVGREPRHPRLGLCTMQTLPRPPCQPDMKLQMATTHPIGVVQLGQSLPDIHADGFQQPVAGPAVALDDLQH